MTDYPYTAHVIELIREAHGYDNVEVYQEPARGHWMVAAWDDGKPMRFDGLCRTRAELEGRCMAMILKGDDWLEDWAKSPRRYEPDYDAPNAAERAEMMDRHLTEVGR